MKHLATRHMIPLFSTIELCQYHYEYFSENGIMPTGVVRKDKLDNYFKSETINSDEVLGRFSPCIMKVVYGFTRIFSINFTA